tara:strand:+ start:1953 stop:2060 length:108 start_codon:yes stop_codon:yes gene_type:complete
MVNSIYGMQEIAIDVKEEEKVTALWFNREPCERIK